MPIYEYACRACGHTLDVIQKMSDEPLTICPECNKPDLQKLMSAAGFQLKGTGWYATDFKNKGKPEVKSDTSTSEPSKPKDDSSSSTSSSKDGSAKS